MLMVSMVSLLASFVFYTITYSSKFSHKINSKHLVKNMTTTVFCFMENMTRFYSLSVWNFSSLKICTNDFVVPSTLTLSITTCRLFYRGFRFEHFVIFWQCTRRNSLREWNVEWHAMLSGISPNTPMLSGISPNRNVLCG